MGAKVVVEVKVKDLQEWDASHEVACELALQISKLIRNSQTTFADLEISTLRVESEG